MIVTDIKSVAQEVGLMGEGQKGCFGGDGNDLYHDWVVVAKGVHLSKPMERDTLKMDNPEYL